MGNILRKGIAAYQQSMRPPENGANEQPENQGGDSVRGAAGAGAANRAARGEPAAQARAAPKAAAQAGAMQDSIAKAQDSIARAKARLRDEGGLLKTVAPKEPDSKTRRVAKFLILIGAEQAAKILGQLDRQQVEEVSKEIALIDKIDPVEADAILAEFRSLFAAPLGLLGSSSGGVETARRMLHSAYGAEKGEALLNKAVPGSKENIFGFLEEFSAEQLVFLLKDEKPGTAALILARLPAKISADAIAKFPQEHKTEILLRIARRREVSPEVLENVAQALKERARHFGSGSADDVEIDGMQTLAAIIRQGDYSFGDRLLNELETEDPEIGFGLKNRLYTLDDVLNAFDRPLAEKLKRMTDKDIAVLLKGRSAEFREKILSNVSSGRRAIVVEEGELMGPVSRRECDEVANSFIAWFRQARAKGSIALSNDEDWVS